MAFGFGALLLAVIFGALGGSDRTATVVRSVEPLRWQASCWQGVVRCQAAGGERV